MDSRQRDGAARDAGVSELAFALGADDRRGVRQGADGRYNTKDKVSKSLDKYNLSAAKAGIAKNNPRILSMTVVELHKAVVGELGKKNVMVVLGNHVSRPTWCCAGNDGNGFFGDAYFDPKEWLQGLAAGATTYKGFPQVVGMSLRNELLALPARVVHYPSRLRRERQ
ncbi:hypothetical protein SASPL_153470 [Salvia splendens]|uniref:Uncharacterized protein n=1 Tax=Salvia splendens TaxID=180675 RepID=A0A8X8W523_SALSN|nr:hypothetical protein SASPL_153470 [Salvia splendens]